MFSPVRCNAVVVLILACLVGVTSGSSCACSTPVGANITYSHMDAVGSVGRVTVLWNMTKTTGPYMSTNYFMVRSDTWYKNDIGLGQIIVKTSVDNSCQGAALIRNLRYILFGSIKDEVVNDYAGMVPVFTVDGCRPQKVTTTVVSKEWMTLLKYSSAPSAYPTEAPSGTPVAAPSSVPTTAPMAAPSTAPTTVPLAALTASPSTAHSSAKVTSPPTASPSMKPTMAPEPFQITLDATIKIPASDKNFFQVAVNRWQSVIQSGHESVPSSLLGPPPANCNYPTTIDDLYLCVTYDHFASDGPGKFVGFALPIYWRMPSLIPLAGFMSLDSADINTLKSKGLMTRTILHELGHVLGIGTQWERTAVTGNIANGCPYFGPKANAEYKALTGCASVATELDGGTGTHCMHWDEFCLGDELMTGWLGGRTQLSRLTIAGLEDLGYSVNYANSDYLGIDDINPQCMCKTNRALFEPEPPAQRQLRHGEVTQLNHVPVEHRRKLSVGGHEQALEAGHAILEMLHRQSGRAVNSTEFQFVADQVVSVLMMEGDDIFGVIVEANDPLK